MNHIKLFNKFTTISENLKYHIDHNLPLLENIFRPYSKSFYELIGEGRNLFEKGELILHGIDKQLFETTDLGKFELYKGELVPLDLPIENLDEIFESEYGGKKVSLNKPMRSSGPKKYKVYVKNPKSGNVIVVNFGDAKGGLSAKVSDPDARRAFTARHQCHLKKDKTKPGY